MLGVVTVDSFPQLKAGERTESVRLRHAVLRGWSIIKRDHCNVELRHVLVAGAVPADMPEITKEDCYSCL